MHTCAVRRLLLCEELDRSSCGSVLFHGYLPPPGKDVKLSDTETELKDHPSEVLFKNILKMENGNNLLLSFRTAQKWKSAGIFIYKFLLILTAIPARKSSPASAPIGSASDERPGPSGAEGFTRVGPLSHPSFSASPGTDDGHKLGK